MRERTRLRSLHKTLGRWSVCMMMMMMAAVMMVMVIMMTTTTMTRWLDKRQDQAAIIGQDAG